MTAAAQEHERAAGAWHAEWETLGDLLRVVGSGASWLADSLGHLEVHADVMRTRAGQALADNGSGDDLAAQTRAAAALVDAALAERASRPA
jgi:3-carboxy-cis,cis-muconate cycloisomerase